MADKQIPPHREVSGKSLDELGQEGRRRSAWRENVLDICLYRNIYSLNGKGSYHFGCIQCGGRAPAAGHFELSGAPGAGCRGHRGGLGAGAAFGVEASAGAAGCWPRASAAEREAYVLSNQRG